MNLTTSATSLAELKELAVLAELAAKILADPEIKYQRDKNMIQKVFEWSSSYEHKIPLRLAVIDGFYSTQMNRRLFLTSYTIFYKALIFNGLIFGVGTTVIL